MKYPKKSALVLAVMVTIASVGAVAYGSQKEPLRAELPTPKITLIQAVTTSEQHAGGQARRAEYERTRAGLAYDVEVTVTNSTKVIDVRINPDNGTVESSNKHLKGANDEHDEAD